MTQTPPKKKKRPKIKIKAKRKLTEGRGHVVAIAISVTGRKLKGRVKLTTIVKGKVRKIGTKKFKTPSGGGSRLVRVKLNKTGRALSASKKRIKALITASGNGATTKRKTVKIKTR